MSTIQEAKSIPAPFRNIEIVERKGLGHPDTLIDNIMENVGRALCEEYLNKFGKIAHYNVDKGLIVGGKSRVEYGGGEILNPVHILLTWRIIMYYNKVHILI